MRRSASLRRKRTGSSRSWLFDEARQFIPVSLPAHVVGIVVAGSLDHHELHRTGGSRGDIASHLHRYQHVRGTMEDECGATNAAHSAHVVEPKPHQEPGEDSL